VTAASTAVWFFTTHVPGLHREGRCHQYGFLFSPMPLDGNAGFLAFNAAVYLLMLLVCLGKVLWRVFCDRRVSERTRHERGDLRLPYVEFPVVMVPPPSDLTGRAAKVSSTR